MRLVIDDIEVEFRSGLEKCPASLFAEL